MSAILLEREIVHYEVLGRGRPVIFMHGWVGSWRYWVPAMQVVSASYRAYAIDLWGFGDTAKAKTRYTLLQQAALINSFMDQMGVGKVALIGHGLGAVVALLLAQSYPKVIDRVMAVACPVDETRLNSRLRSAGSTELADWLLERSALTEPARADAPKADQPAIQNSLTELAATGLRKLLSSLPVACLLVHGQNDPAVELPRMEDQISMPEQTHSIIFEGSGHFPMLDESGKFNRLLIDFLALPSGTSPRDLQLKEEWVRRVR